MFEALHGALSPTTFALVCMLIMGVLLAGYSLLAKKTLMDRATWAGRDAVFTFLVQGGASFFLFVVWYQSGNAAVLTEGWSWNNGFWGPAVLTGLLNIGIQLASNRAKALEDVSLVTPIHSTTPAIVIVTSMIILGEYPTPIGWLGVWLLAIGTYALQIQDAWNVLVQREEVVEGNQAAKGGWKFWVRVWLSPVIALKSSRGVRWAFFAVLLGTFAINYDGLVARNGDVAFASGCVFGIAALGNLVLALMNREFMGFRLPISCVWDLVMLAALFAMLHIALNWAYREALVSYIGSLKRISIPLTIMGAYFFLGEKKSFGGRLIGGVLMAIGATLIAIGMSQ